MRAAMSERASRASILASSQLVVWASEAVSCLLASSATEDALGVVQLGASLGVTLGALVSSHGSHTISA